MLQLCETQRAPVRTFASAHAKHLSPMAAMLLVEDVERLEYYRPGGYHPIQIGDRFHERYRIVHKLGYGSFSTIWLARDEPLSRYVAVKVCTADAIQQKHDEVDTLSRLSTAALPNGIGGRFLVQVILDHFSIRGPNGTHCCLLALAIARAHGQGLVHGDLHLGNILLQMPSGLDRLSEEELYNKYGAPEPEPVVRLDGKPLSPGVPSHAIPPVWLGEPCENICASDAGLILSDFGVAFRPAEELRFESYTPLEIRPPEARFEPTTPLSFASDIWSLGCTIWAMLSHRSLFDGNFLATDDDVLAQQVDVLGPLPAEWWEKWEGRFKKFTEAGQPLEGRSVWTSNRRFDEWIQQPRHDKEMATLEQKEREAFSAMIRWMLSFKPGDRPSAKEVLETEWMRNWALPEFEKAQEEHVQ
ncbi:hypothetical protein VTK56DRAFT_10201 [Thermocarpiscus australiensis]